MAFASFFLFVENWCQYTVNKGRFLCIGAILKRTWTKWGYSVRGGCLVFQMRMEMLGIEFQAGYGMCGSLWTGYHKNLSPGSYFTNQV